MPTAEDMAAFLGRPGDAATVTRATSHLPVVTAMVKAHTRGRGFTADILATTSPPSSCPRPRAWSPTPSTPSSRPPDRSASGEASSTAGPCPSWRSCTGIGSGHSDAAEPGRSALRYRTDGHRGRHREASHRSLDLRRGNRHGVPRDRRGLRRLGAGPARGRPHDGQRRWATWPTRPLHATSPADADVQINDVLTLTDCPGDPGLVGREIGITDVKRDAWQVARFCTGRLHGSA